ncbi:MAG TPA: flavodoxin domain-containing protein [Methanomassiliicoccales archaeon]|nr:flavodoxin domain-containing protein [Methanomassiliicoccales archaeon]
MKVAIYYESKYGNGKAIVTRLSEMLTTHGIQVEVQHIDEAEPKEMDQADLYVFSSPTRLGKLIGSMKRFLRKASLPNGARYALIATHLALKPDRKTAEMPGPDEVAKLEQTLAMMEDILNEKGARKVASLKLHVSQITQLSLENGWEQKVDDFAVELRSKM